MTVITSGLHLAGTGLPVLSVTWRDAGEKHNGQVRPSCPSRGRRQSQANGDHLGCHTETARLDVYRPLNDLMSGFGFYTLTFSPPAMFLILTLPPRFLPPAPLM